MCNQGREERKEKQIRGEGIDGRGREEDDHENGRKMEGRSWRDRMRGADNIRRGEEGGR